MFFFNELSPGSKVFVQGAAATPMRLLQLLTQESSRYAPLTLYHLHTEGELPYLQPEVIQNFQVRNLFVGSNIRKSVDLDQIDYLPCFLSEMPQLFRRGHLLVDAVLISVSPPDQHGYVSLGTSVDTTRAALDTARYVYAQINSKVPRTHGDTFIHISKITRFVEITEELPEAHGIVCSDIENTIGQNVAELVENGATLQIGIGALPEATLKALSHHKDLGLHSEMFSDQVLPLINSGVINNRRKVVHPGKSIATFLNGTKKLFQFVNDNPSVCLFEASYVNSPIVIMRNPKVTSINSAVEIDLTGQVCADSVGPRIVSGVGGQMDFLRAAALSEGGKPILAITSRSKTGTARIVPTLKSGAGVVTTRAHVHHIVTEYGSANLVGKSLGERARALIQIAHPNDREFLDREWQKIRKGL